jgi:hypothetical protein
MIRDGDTIWVRVHEQDEKGCWGGGWKIYELFREVLGCKSLDLGLSLALALDLLDLFGRTSKVKISCHSASGLSSFFPCGCRPVAAKRQFNGVL